MKTNTRKVNHKKFNIGEILADRFFEDVKKDISFFRKHVDKKHLNLSMFVVFMGFSMFALSGVGYTATYYFDVEESNDNIHSAGSLNLSLTTTEFESFIGLAEKINFGSVLTNAGTLPFQYTVGIEKMSGSDDFCGALDLEAELNGIEKHDDDLLLLDVPTSTMLGSWSFENKLPFSASSITHGEECEVDLVFRGWQTNVGSFEDSGFSDEDRINVLFTSRMIVLNEFLPRPDGVEYGFDFGDDSSDMPKGEWVELYNNSDSAFDLTGWYVWDASGSEANKIAITALNTLPAGTTVGAKSWLVVYMNKAVLNNTGDTVKLYDGSDTLIDSHTYDGDPNYCDIEPTPGDENSTSITGDCSSVPPNKSYARIPDGIGFWVDPIPTPGFPNTEDEAEGVESLGAFVEANSGDTEPPIIIILGNNPALIPIGSTYNDNGAIVTDNIDTNLSATVVDAAAVDTDTVGTYKVFYFATDSAGNEASAIREVIVYDPALGVPVIEPDDPAPAETSGCTDPTALNFNLDATEDDSSCTFTVEEVEVAATLGCTDPTALNFDPDATEDDSSCTYPVEEPIATLGCTDPTALNFDPDATEDDNSCTYPVEDQVVTVEEPIATLGCTDPTALNFDPDATEDDNSCTYPVEEPIATLGCTDPTALNFDPDATEDDNSCTFTVEEVEVVAIFGCTDPTALNFDPDATEDDNSCTYPDPAPAATLGCTDSTALNFDPDATEDDNSCTYTVEEVEVAAIFGCTDPTALNFNLDATEDDSSCTYPVEEPDLNI